MTSFNPNCLYKGLLFSPNTVVGWGLQHTLWVGGFNLQIWRDVIQSITGRSSSLGPRTSLKHVRIWGRSHYKLLRGKQPVQSSVLVRQGRGWPTAVSDCQCWTRYRENLGEGTARVRPGVQLERHLVNGQPDAGPRGRDCSVSRIKAFSPRSPGPGP